MAALNNITGVSVGQFGVAISVVIVDDDNVAIDVSSYTTITTYLRAPDALKAVSLNTSFTTDGTDGAVYFAPANGDINVPGMWEGQIALEKTGAETHTQKFDMDVIGEL